MPTVVKEDLGNQGALLSVTLDLKDYESRYNDELGRFKNKAQLRGFRKGKTPLTFVRKMYGEAILADLVNDMVGKAINDYLAEQQINIIGYPIPTAEQERINLDPVHPDSYTFQFEIGMYPEFTVTGLSKDDVIEWPDIQIDEKLVDSEVENMQRWGGKQSPVEDGIEANDMIEFSAKETDKEEGISTNFKVLVRTLHPALKETLLGQKKEHQLRWNIFELEENTSESYVRKYLLHLPENDTREVNPTFELTVAEVLRPEYAEINSELIEKYFGEPVGNTEEDVRTHFRQDIKRYYDQQADNLFFGRVMEYLFQKNPIELPEPFIKKWLKFKNEKATDESIEKNFAKYTESLRRRILFGKLVGHFGIRITEEEILDELKKIIRDTGYGRGADDTLLASMAEFMYKDEKYKEMVEKSETEILTRKVLQALKSTLSLNPVEVSIEEYQQMVKDINKTYDEYDQLEHEMELSDATETQA